jgi:hypothetical protein
MEFVGWKCRHEGRLLPRHVMWAGRSQGELYVREKYDTELARHVRVATLEVGEGHKVVLGPLFDAVLVACKPDWWTMTGWERIDATVIAPGRAFQQSWILMPLDRERG